MSATATEAPAPTLVEEPDLPDPQVSETIIRPRKGWIGLDWTELYHYRELLYFLVWRDVKVRYKQAIFGMAWAIVQPVLQVVIFTFVFGSWVGLDKRLPPEVPFALFVYAGLLPWQLFALGISQGGQSLVSFQHMLSKIYMPRLFIPSAVVGGGLVDMALSFGVFAALMVFYGFVPAWTVIFFPLLVLLTILAALGVAFTLSALTVSYRDFRILIPFIVQIGMYVSAVMYPTSIAEGKLRWVLLLNPIAGLIEAYRSAILGWPHWHWPHLTYSAVMIVAMFVFGLFYFRKTERRFADIV